MSNEQVEKTQYAQIPVHLWTYLHCNDRLQIRGLICQAIKQEMWNDEIDPEKARSAFLEADLDHEADALRSRFTGVSQYEQFITDHHSKHGTTDEN